MGAIVTTAVSLNSGVSPVAGAAKRFQVGVTGSWATGETFIATLADAITAAGTVVGAGAVTGLAPTYAFTLKEKLYLLAGDGMYFSDFKLGPTVFNSTTAAGNGFISLKNNFGTSETQVGMANFQGGLAVQARNSTQIWDVDPLVENYNQRQVLKGVGTFAKASVQAQGDADVYFLGASGPRSLRVRAATTNATPFDVGAPVQKLVKAVLRTLSQAQREASCSITDPDTFNYWLYIPAASGAGMIWVLANAPESGVLAWTQYIPSYEIGFAITITGGATGGSIASLTAPDADGVSTVEIAFAAAWNTTPELTATALADNINAKTGDSGYTAAAVGAVVFVTAPAGALGITAGVVATITGSLTYTIASRMATFTPTKFIISEDRIYARSGDDVFLYGGAENNSYDTCGAQADTPFLNGKTPATRKTYKGVDVACEGTWSIAIGSKPSNPNAVTTVYRNTDSSFERGLSLAALQGTHFKMRAIESGGGYAILSAVIIHFEGGDNK